jgi:hypothetical protein
MNIKEYIKMPKKKKISKKQREKLWYETQKSFIKDGVAIGFYIDEYGKKHYRSY